MACSVAIAIHSETTDISSAEKVARFEPMAVLAGGRGVGHGILVCAWRQYRIS
jgi:hypothetical protein